MKKKHTYWGSILSGAAAGTINGLFGAGGGMVLIPLLTATNELEEDTLFPTSVSIMFPICLVSISVAFFQNGGLPWQDSWPYLIGSFAGGILAGKFGNKIPALWLHRGLGLLILWGGVRYLC